jgi:hypothetical protein
MRNETWGAIDEWYSTRDVGRRVDEGKTCKEWLGWWKNDGDGVSAYCDPQQTSVQVGFTKKTFLKTVFPIQSRFSLYEYFYKNREGLSNEPVTVTD